MGAIVGGVFLGVLGLVPFLAYTHKFFHVQGKKELYQVGEQVEGLSINWRRWFFQPRKRQGKIYGCTLQFSAKGKVVVCENFICHYDTYERLKDTPSGQFFPISVTYDPDKLDRFALTDELKDMTEGSFSSVYCRECNYCFWIICISICIGIPIIVFSFIGDVLNAVISFLLVLILGESIILLWHFKKCTVKKVESHFDAIINDESKNGVKLVVQHKVGDEPTRFNQGRKEGSVQMYYAPTVQQQQPQPIVGQTMQQPMQMQPQQQYYYGQQQGQPMMMQGQQPMGYAMQQPMQQQYMQPQSQYMQSVPQTGGAVAVAVHPTYVYTVPVSAPAPASTIAGTTGGPYV